MGNSEVGHLNIGAGRVVYQDLVKINRACKDGSILENPEIKAAFGYAKETGKKLHLMGLTSNGGVHSSFDHLFYLCDIAKTYGLDGKTFIHCFMDGRDTDPKSGLGFIDQLQQHLATSCGEIASIQGRFYAMDRDKRWERVKVAYDCIVKGEGKAAEEMLNSREDERLKKVAEELAEKRKKEAHQGHNHGQQNSGMGFGGLGTGGFGGGTGAGGLRTGTSTTGGNMGGAMGGIGNNLRR